jgi:uncharacterized membrane protein YjjP (DUF1212 family)
MRAVSRQLGIEGQFFSTPTAIIAAFGPLKQQRTHLVRVDPGEVHLEKLAALDRVAAEVGRGALPVADGAAQVEAIEAAPPRYGAALTVLAFGLFSAAAGRFFGGGLPEIAAGGSIGLVIGLLSLAFTRSYAGVPVFELIAALVSALAAHAAVSLGTPVSFHIVTLTGIIALIPGLTLTVAMAELATRNLVSGTARLTAAAISFLEIAFGVALAERLWQALGGAAPAPDALVGAALPGWSEPVAVVVAALSVVVLDKAHPRAAPGVLAASVAAYYGARLGAVHLGPELGACVGAFVVTAGSNAHARVTGRTTLVMLVPGLLMLVPGSLGFRSVASLLERDVVTGIDTAFSMILIAVAIVAGLLVANATVPPRRTL